MEQIIVNADAREKVIDWEATQAINEIIKNAKAGNHNTDLYFPKYISYAVRDKVEEMLKARNTRFTWNVVARGHNEFTGRPESFMSESVGDDRHYQLQILS
jgi:hypothetical protein